MEIPPGAYGDVVQRCLQDERCDSAEHVQCERLQQSRSMYAVGFCEKTDWHSFVNSITSQASGSMPGSVDELLLTGDTI